MRGKTLVDYAVYLGVRVVIAVVQALPLDICDQLSSALATLCSRWLRIRFRVSEENLQAAYPALTTAERERLIWRMWHHLFLLVVEIAHAQRKIHRSNWRRHITFPDEQGSVRAMLMPGSKVVVSGHFGNFEVAGFMLGLMGFPAAAVARPLENPYLDRYLGTFRSGTGQSVISKQGSASEIADLLESGKMLALLGDQAAGPRGCWVEFFGRPASAHKAIAVFSLANQIPLMVSYTRRVGAPLQFESAILALADPRDSGYKLGTVPALTQWYSDRLEEIVNLAPEQYWWLHRRWKGEPPASWRAAEARAA